MPFSTVLLAGPAKIGAVLVGATLVGVGGYAAYDRYYAPSPYDEPLPLLPATQVGLFEPAPPVSALPLARPAPVGYIDDPVASYAWAERASALSYAFADVPPDYGYGYDDTEYWAWESDDGWILDVEPVYGGDRYYYYGPDGDYPFFIRDAGYGYGFDNGVLVVVYDSYGRVMPRDFVRARSDWAGRYLYRAAALRQARLEAERADRRWRVDRARWLSRQDRLYDSQVRLEQAALQQPQWQAYRQSVDNRDRRHFAEERRERLQAVREMRAERRQNLREARRSSDAPPVLTLAERRQLSRGDELVVNRQRLQDPQTARERRAERLAERAEDRVTRRALARDEAARPRAEARREMLATRQAARTERQRAYRDAKAEQRAAVAANPTREGKAEARREVLEARAAARAERKQAYRDVQPGRGAPAVRDAPRVRAAAVERRERAAEARSERLAQQRAIRAERAAARPAPRAERAVERRVERAAPPRPERVMERRAERAAPPRAERAVERRAEARAERPARVQAQREDRQAARAARQQARQERLAGRD